MSGTIRLRSSEVDWRAIEREVVALDSRRSLYFGVNEAGALLWQALASGTTNAELVATLVEHFGISTVRAETDVGAFLAALEAEDLLEVGDA